MAAPVSWLEMVDPSEEERTAVASVFGLSLIDTQDVDELEACAHHVTNASGPQVNCLFFHQLEDQPRNTNVSFVYDGERLVSLSSREIPHACLLRRRNWHGILDQDDALALLPSLLETKVDTPADETERPTALWRKSATWCWGATRMILKMPSMAWPSRKTTSARSGYR